ncbi:MAG: hypothetical protein HQK49_03135 [Oligoflexia bacterium]|nr:hypothetical protein [Oligoflexia bacterium]
MNNNNTNKTNKTNKTKNILIALTIMSSILYAVLISLPIFAQEQNKDDSWEGHVTLKVTINKAPYFYTEMKPDTNVSVPYGVDYSSFGNGSYSHSFNIKDGKVSRSVVSGQVSLSNVANNVIIIDGKPVAPSGTSEMILFFWNNELAPKDQSAIEITSVSDTSYQVGLSSTHKHLKQFSWMQSSSANPNPVPVKPDISVPSQSTFLYNFNDTDAVDEETRIVLRGNKQIYQKTFNADKFSELPTWYGDGILSEQAAAPNMKYAHLFRKGKVTIQIHAFWNLIKKKKLWGWKGSISTHYNFHWNKTTRSPFVQGKEKTTIENTNVNFYSTINVDPKKMELGENQDMSFKYTGEMQVKEDADAKVNCPIPQPPYNIMKSTGIHTTTNANTSFDSSGKVKVSLPGRADSIDKLEAKFLLPTFTGGTGKSTTSGTTYGWDYCDYPQNAGGPPINLDGTISTPYTMVWLKNGTVINNDDGSITWSGSFSPDEQEGGPMKTRHNWNLVYGPY